MWYQLYINVEKLEYKIGKPKICFDDFLKKQEEIELEIPNYSMGAIYYNYNNYFSKNKKALELKVEEVAHFHAERIEKEIIETKEQIKELEEFLKKYKKRLDKKIDLRCDIMDNLTSCKYYLTYKEETID